MKTTLRVLHGPRDSGLYFVTFVDVVREPAMTREQLKEEAAKRVLLNLGEEVKAVLD